MAGVSRFYIAEGKIKSFFSQSTRTVYSEALLADILEKERWNWNLPQTMNIVSFIDKLHDRKILNKITLNFEGYFANKVRYITTNASELEIAASLMPKAYLSHYTAVFLHGLTTQIPKTIYTTFEQSKKNFLEISITQKAIDAAFTKPQRKTETKAIYNDYNIVMLNGKYTNRVGVLTINEIPVTNIERTLIDITVRPNYAGGVYSVLETYKNSLDKISINKLAAILENMDFIYPYHQCIGFYLEKSGFDIQKLEALRSKKMQFDFYLTYEMQDMEYSKKWKIYYPKGL